MHFWVFFTEDKIEYYDSDACELHLSSVPPIEIVANSKIIFDYLIINRNTPMSRHQIIQRIDGIEEDETEEDRVISNKFVDRTPVDQAISELRKKLDKYSDCIKTVRGIGYKYVGPPLVDKKTVSTLSEPDTSVFKSNKVNVPISVSIRENKPSKLSNSEIRSSRVVSKLENSFKQLVAAADVDELNRAIFRIKTSVKSYVDEVALSYLEGADETDGDSLWMCEAGHHERWLRRVVTYYRAEIEGCEYTDEIIDIKLQFLDYIYDIHIVMELLGAQLSLEKEALELSGKLIGKEERLSRINRIERDYKFAAKDATEHEASISEKIGEYAHSHTVDKATI